MRCEWLPVHWAELRESCLNHIPPPCTRQTPALKGYTVEMIDQPWKNPGGTGPLSFHLDLLARSWQS